METQYLVAFLLSCHYPFLTLCLSESSEEYQDEDRLGPSYGTEIQWVDQGQDRPSFRSLSEPAGYEETFLCRAYHSKTWVPGKLVGKSCYITKNRMKHSFDEFQVPSIPAHKRTRWVALTDNLENRLLPRNVVVGGNYWDSIAYICRGILNSRVVIPGSYHPSENICFLEHDGVQIAWKGNTEVLVLDEKASSPNPLFPEDKTGYEI